ncbi:glycosyl hydrolase 115 family protein [Flavobacterium sp. MDT1-60]|uniref:glycosyl hydrolase 115 family protein n=1 Tax=Flavobacterium sp. MDT1-60 TaxID=1979344 RepID=UPI001785AFE9|nr:glycosyl hydrolase 115 family protein [Flavobacterium sp. MDT1-60]QOG04294.1 glycosyl hydrolase 115 family protein [Flavobacterium sp. MDT1-60]
MRLLKSPLLSIILLLFLFGISTKLYAINGEKYVVNKVSPETFPLASKGKVASILISNNDFPGVLRVAGHLENDLFKVTNVHPKQINSISETKDFVVIIGTIGKSEIIDQLVREGKIDASQLKGKWEKFTTQIVDNPSVGIKKALVIAGSDKRGTIYGMYDLSNQIGISPWYFWADVPVKKQSELHVLSGIHSNGEPKVKYRGIFINDEAPALSGWAFDTYGGFNAKFYDKVFELILRMKGNYLWPSMWGRMFYVDDPQNAVLADEYGIVMGTSHHEPLTRAHAEWAKLGKGKWDFSTNSENLISFWKEGMKRMGNTETIVTVGMRGDGDEPMTQGTAIDLLENIVKTQREIIKETTKKPIEETPQMWALYKEVQDYYDKGMRVPDDITLLLCDDNWGNIRKLPQLSAKPRKGGYGIYYHFDYVGGPRNYKWINTNQIERTWEQMDLAYQYGVDKIWIVNVGDIKPMEFPTEFFLDMAWNPEKWNAGNLEQYYVQWAKENFDDQNTEEIAEIIKLYTKYNSRRKPELLNEKTYSITNYNEAETVLADYKKLVEKANAVNEKIKPEYKDAFYQLVLFPVLASANLNELYVATAKNKLYASQGRASANAYAKQVKELFQKDSLLTNYYHTKLANGKWNHMMAQTHIGYTSWQEPKNNVIPETKIIELSNKAEAGIAIEGSANWWTNTATEIVLPTFNSAENKAYFVDIFNRGTIPFDFKITSKENWIKFSKSKGKINLEERILISIDWKKAPKNDAKSQFTISANNQNFTVIVNTKNIDLSEVKGFVESNGFVSIEAQHYSRAINSEVKWTTISNIGKTESGVTLKPSNVASSIVSDKSPILEYDVHLFSTGEVKVHAYFSPTINFSVHDGLKYGIAIDNEKPRIINFNEKDSDKTWNKAVADNIKIITSSHTIEKTGNHTLKFYGIDPALVLQKIVIETDSGKILESYLGPPESFQK